MRSTFWSVYAGSDEIRGSWIWKGPKAHSVGVFVDIDGLEWHFNGFREGQAVEKRQLQSALCLL